MPDPIVLPRLARTRDPRARSSTWWGRALVRSFEELTVQGDDLGAARSLARSGRVGAVVVLESMASAVVDTDDGPQVAQVRVRRLDHDGWGVVAQETARESGFVAAIESGELPADLVEHADEAGVELLPGTAEIDTGCECAAPGQPCMHTLALLYQLAWHVDRDPYVLLLLRGRTREDLLAEVEALARDLSDLGAEERTDAVRRAAMVLALAAEAPDGHGLTDARVAAYDEAVSRLL